MAQVAAAKSNPKVSYLASYAIVGRRVGGGVKEGGVDGVVQVGVVERRCGESGEGNDVGEG